MPQQRPTRSEPGEEDAVLLELERGFWEHGSPERYQERFAPDGRCVFSFGVLDKSATVASMEGGAGWTEVTFTDTEVLTLHADVRTLLYLADATHREGHRYQARVSSTYVRRDGAWLLVLHHQLPVD